MQFETQWICSCSKYCFLAFFDIFCNDRTSILSLLVKHFLNFLLAYIFLEMIIHPFFSVFVSLFHLLHQIVVFSLTCDCLSLRFYKDFAKVNLGQHSRWYFKHGEKLSSKIEHWHSWWLSSSRYCHVTDRNFWPNVLCTSSILITNLIVKRID